MRYLILTISDASFESLVEAGAFTLADNETHLVTMTLGTDDGDTFVATAFSVENDDPSPQVMCEAFAKSAAVYEDNEYVPEGGAED